jgi:hypothetical protein
VPGLYPFRKRRLLVEHGAGPQLNVNRPEQLPPERLPRAYEKWIGEAAQVDSRLIEALRRVRRGVFVYSRTHGKDTCINEARDKGFDSRPAILGLAATGPAMANPLEHHRPELAGRTMDLTIYMVTRAIDAVACVAWGRWSRRRQAQNRWTTIESLVPGFVANSGR